MSESLCFATFTRILQEAMLEYNSDEKLTKLLLDYVIDVADVRNGAQSGETQFKEPYLVDSKVTHNLLTRKANLYHGILKASSDLEVMEGAEEFFTLSVVPYINQNLTMDLVDKLKQLITADESIGDRKRNELLEDADAERLPTFLSKVYIYALSKPNKEVEDRRRKSSQADESKEKLAAISGASLLTEETLSKVVSNVLSVLFTSGQSEEYRFQNFKDAEFHQMLHTLMDAGKMTYYELYKCKNFLEIVEKADEELLAKESKPTTSSAFDFDWFLRFFEASSCISNEEMQQLWAKVLAGEIEQQGSFSLRTMETLRNMTACEARIFQQASKLVLTGTSDDTPFIFCDDIMEDGVNAKHGFGVKEVLAMEESGLISALRTENVIDISDGAGGFLSPGGLCLTVMPERDTEFMYKAYPLSQTGLELLSVVEEEPNEEYLLDLARALKRNYEGKVGIHVLELIGVDENGEFIVDYDYDFLENTLLSDE